MAPLPDQAPESATVLVVEDEVVIRLMIADELRLAGFRVVEAANADEALDVLQTIERVDLIITDVRMPGSMDGFSLADLVRSTWPAIKIIITSAHQSASNVRGDAFFGKPYDPAMVVDRTTQLLTEPSHDPD